MSNKRKLHALRTKGKLDEIESKISKELGFTNNELTDKSYLASYDASLLNKNLVRMPKEKSNKK